MEGFKRNEFEVIVADDGSSDDTESYIKGINTSYELKYIYLKRDDSSCRSKARNCGIKAAEGEFIIFIDADIIVKKDYLLEVDRFCSKNKNIFMAGLRLMLPEDIPFETVKDGSVFEKYTFDPEHTEFHEFRCDILEELSYNAAAILYPFMYGQTCNLVAPKSMLDKINGFDEALKAWGLEDIELCYRLWKMGLRFVLNSKLEVLHQFHWVEGKIVDESKLAGVMENTRLLLLKHPDIFNLPEDKVYELFKSIANNFRFVEKPIPETCNRIIIDFKNKAYLKDIKQIIVMSSESENNDIIVKDYLENTDLDVWIQQLGKRASTPRYYPMSRKLKKL
ncbi:GT2 family glycosyltransferase [Ruminiclostridium sufflavum DSM 19573]|uniref:GT2 family glycosyltransferase n=1 Tax=Ruminiclostridium sufflavum DSM 19573 TaxID=1121337 RepID=A0A318XJ69_9FIRM|nr:GT2 family glycosyltransferase [Ruminiclostridium sufflavum DSM 19573]